MLPQNEAEVRPTPVREGKSSVKARKLDDVVLAQPLVGYLVVAFPLEKYLGITAKLLKSIHKLASHLDLKFGQMFNSSSAQLQYSAQIPTSYCSQLLSSHEHVKTIRDKILL